MSNHDFPERRLDPPGLDIDMHSIVTNRIMQYDEKVDEIVHDKGSEWIGEESVDLAYLMHDIATQQCVTHEHVQRFHAIANRMHDMVRKEVEQLIQMEWMK